MPSLDDHFAALSKVSPPDPWPDVDRRAARSLSEPLARRRIGVAALALLIAAAGFFLAVRAFRGPAPTTEAKATPRASPQSHQTGGGPSPKQRQSPLETGMFGAMLDAIRGSSPPGWEFSLRGDRLDGDWRVDGDANDGAGPGRLYVDVTFRPGMLGPHPCADAEFRQGSSCEERPLPGGDLLVLRDVVVDTGGMKTIEAVLVHPDGSGVGAEAGNWTIAALPSGPVGQDQLPNPRVTRPDPLYSVEQLARLVQSVDQGTRDCVRTGCR